MTPREALDQLVCVDCATTFLWDESPSAERCVTCFDIRADFYGWPDSADLTALGWARW